MENDKCQNKKTLYCGSGSGMLGWMELAACTNILKDGHIISEVLVTQLGWAGLSGKIGFAISKCLYPNNFYFDICSLGDAKLVLKI